MTTGRPTKYKPEYCKQLIKHMAEGLSFEAFGGEIEVSKQTLYEWRDVHKEFSDAKEVGFQKSRAFWEKIGVQQARDGQGNATAFVFNMKNRFPAEWRDKQEVSQDVNLKTEVKVEFGDRDG